MTVMQLLWMALIKHCIDFITLMREGKSFLEQQVQGTLHGPPKQKGEGVVVYVVRSETCQRGQHITEPFQLSETKLSLDQV